jgi:hypothetical protein
VDILADVEDGGLERAAFFFGLKMLWAGGKEQATALRLGSGREADFSTAQLTMRL